MEFCGDLCGDLLYCIQFFVILRNSMHVNVDGVVSEFADDIQIGGVADNDRVC